MPRKTTRSVQVGPVTVGGAAPIVVQSMTNTDTEDAIRTVAQIANLARAGSELVRITVNTEAAANAVPEIRDRLLKMDVDVPLVGDFHFNGHKLLSAVPDCATALAKYRINPGNVGRGAKRDEQFAQMIEIAARNDKPVRIGANWGSLDQELLARMLDDNAALRHPKPLEQINREAVIKSALDSAARAVELGLPRNRIILSCKMSRVQDLVQVYESLASQCDYALHLGLTEAGMGSKGIVASTAALALLLQQGIGDTIRISLTPEPGGDRTKEVRGGPGNPANHGLALLYSHGDGLPRMRSNQQHLFSGTCQPHPDLPARQHAGMESGPSWRCRHVCCSHGLRGQRSG